MGHLSYSQISTYMRCPAEYYFKYVREIPSPSNAYMVRGLAVHKGIEESMRQKIKTHKDLPVDDVIDLALDRFWKAKDDAEISHADKTAEDVISLTKLYMAEIAPSIQPVMVEEQMEIVFDGFKKSLLGYIDLVDDKGVIHDIKTSKRSPGEKVIDDNLQLACYSLLYRSAGYEESGLSLDYLITTKTPKAESFTTSIDDRGRERFLNIMTNVNRGIENGIYYPNTQSLYCSSSCPYYKECKKEW